MSSISSSSSCSSLSSYQFCDEPPSFDVPFEETEPPSPNVLVNPLAPEETGPHQECVTGNLLHLEKFDNIPSQFEPFNSPSAPVDPLTPEEVGPFNSPSALVDPSTPEETGPFNSPSAPVDSLAPEETGPFNSLAPLTVSESQRTPKEKARLALERLNGTTEAVSGRVDSLVSNFSNVSDQVDSTDQFSRTFATRADTLEQQAAQTAAALVDTRQVVEQAQSSSDQAAYAAARAAHGQQQDRGVLGQAQQTNTVANSQLERVQSQQGADEQTLHDLQPGVTQLESQTRDMNDAMDARASSLQVTRQQQQQIIEQQIKQINNCNFLLNTGSVASFFIGIAASAGLGAWRLSVFKEQLKSILQNNNWRKELLNLIKSWGLEKTVTELGIVLSPTALGSTLSIAMQSCKQDPSKVQSLEQFCKDTPLAS